MGRGVLLPIGEESGEEVVPPNRIFFLILGSRNAYFGALSGLLSVECIAAFAL